MANINSLMRKLILVPRTSNLNEFCTNVKEKTDERRKDAKDALRFLIHLFSCRLQAFVFHEYDSRASLELAHAKATAIFVHSFHNACETQTYKPATF